MDDLKARNAHLRRKLRVNIQSYLEQAGVAPTAAASMAADLNRDVWNTFMEHRAMDRSNANAIRRKHNHRSLLVFAFITLLLGAAAIVSMPFTIIGGDYT
ncbi:hypothetical protein K4K51_004231 [Colletotrichum sp. SAR 10_75]|nr:hypothetical protein K4K51_004231 [Colletotrichum sp. SAR 10_75]